MLGNQIYEGKGKVTGHRVLETDIPKVEYSYTMQSRLKGIEITETGTYTSTMRPDGTVLGEDKAIFMANDGSGSTATAQGIGRFTGPDKMSFRGFAIMGSAGTGSLATLNSTVVAFEVEVEGENLSIKGWEWN